MPLAARPVWAEINLDHIEYNLKLLKNSLEPEVGVMAVVKANGYGHGAVETARAALRAGASRLAVAFAAEALELRRAGLDAPILIFGRSDPGLTSLLLENDLTPTVFDLFTASSLSSRALEAGGVLPVHVKVDTGMNRLGLQHHEAAEAVLEIAGLPGLKVEGLYTHFAAADEKDISYTEEQEAKFDQVVEQCRMKGLQVDCLHAANSAAALRDSRFHYNMVRPGIMLYGSNPLPSSVAPIKPLKPALTLKSKIVQLKKVSADQPVSYGCTYRTKGETTIATVAAGYADGYNRLLSNRGRVILRGNKAPIVGRVCMDYIMVDVSHIPAARVGDEVVLIGSMGGQTVSADDLAALCGTISYELFCAVGRRVPRFYFSGGRLISVEDYLEKETLRPY